MTMATYASVATRSAFRLGRLDFSCEEDGVYVCQPMTRPGPSIYLYKLGHGPLYSVLELEKQQSQG